MVLEQLDLHPPLHAVRRCGCDPIDSPDAKTDYIHTCLACFACTIPCMYAYTVEYILAVHVITEKGSTSKVEYGIYCTRLDSLKHDAVHECSVGAVYSGMYIGNRAVQRMYVQSVRVRTQYVCNCYVLV